MGVNLRKYKKYGGRTVSKDTRKLARKLVRGKSGEVKLTGSRKQRKRAAVREVYAMKKNAKFGNNGNKTQGGNELAMLKSYKSGGLIQHD
jgi:hypothetical protein